MVKYFVSISIIVCITMQPFLVFAQSTGGVICLDGVRVTDSSQCDNTKATNNTLNRFSPGLNTGTGQGSFGGLSFSGVGGAVLSCANIGQSVVSTVSDLFKNSEQKKKDDQFNALPQPASVAPGTSEEQPVTDKKATEELKKETQRENCLNGVAYAVAKNALQQMTSKTLNWVNTGFNGNPFYVRDMNSYLGTIQNDKIASFLDTVPTSDPIFGNALRSSITELTTGYNDGRFNQVMNTPQAQAYQNFQDDFTQGGWSAFLDPSNNPLGALFKATDSLSNSINSAQQNVKDQVQAGNGFLDMQKCVEYAPATQSDVVNPLGGYSTLCATITPANQAYCQTHASQAVAGTQQQKCIRYETTTPGSIIQAQTAATVTSPIRQAEQADKINEVLGSFFDGLVNRLFSQGLNSLSGIATNGGTTCTAGGAGCNVVIGSNGLPVANAAVSAEDAFGYERVSGGFYGEFDISRPQQLRAVIQAQMDFLNRSEDTQIAMSRIVPTLGKLDYCFPGPNPSWTIGTNYNFQLFDASLQGKQPNKTLGNAISQLSGAAALIPGPGPLIAVVGNIVGGLINLASGDEPKEISTQNLQLFDKVTNGARQITDYSIRRQTYGDNIDLVAYLERNYGTVMDQYQAKFDPNTITKAFEAINPADKANIDINVGDIIDETGNLTYYNQAISDYGKEQTENITETQTAIQQLSAINDEVEGIVAGAKARYIKQMRDAKTPVDVDRVIDPATGKPGELCIDQAYNVSTASIVGATRQEADIANPIVQQSKDAATYFYSHL